MSFMRPPEVTLRMLSRRNLCTTSILSSQPTAAMSSYKAAVCESFSKPLVIRSQSTEPLEDGQILIASKFCALSFATILSTKGLYQVKSELPFIPGNEIGGEVLEVAANVKGFTVGDKVVGILQSEGLSQRVAVTPEGEWANAAISVLPSGVSYEEASGSLTNYCTAWLAFTRKAKIQPGQTVLISGAAGGVGQAAVDLAANVFGCTVIAGCSSEEKCEVARKFGAAHTINYSVDNIKVKAKELTDGRGVDIALDNVGGNMAVDMLKALAFEGNFLTIGFASGTIPKLPANQILLRSAAVSSVWWGNYMMQNSSVFMESIRAVLDLLAQKKIRPHISEVFPLEKVNEAIDSVYSRKSTGKVVINLDD